MARKKGITSAGNNPGFNVLIMGAGVVMALIIDYATRAYTLGSKTPSNVVEGFSVGDLVQVSLYSLMTFIGLIQGRRDFSNFSYGLLSGKMIPSIVFPTIGLQRYGIFGIKESGAGEGTLSPIWKNPFPT